MNTATETKTDLKTRWAEYRAAHPKTRIRNAANDLGVSEGELVATGCGDNVTRLEADWGALLKELGALGRVLAITRNDEVVHERKGVYSRVELFPAHNNMGQVLDEGIDLRLFMNHWRYGFATLEGERRSLQFFAPDGAAVHKVYLLPESDGAAYFALVEKYRSANQSPELPVTPAPTPAPDKPDGEIDLVTFRSRWAAMKDTHEFNGLLREFGVGREQALRLADLDMAWPVARDSYRPLLENAAREEQRIMVFAGNPGVIQIHSGTVHKIFPHGEWFNVMDADFNLHLNETGVARAYVVRKPTVDGIVSSLELFNAAGRNIALFFSKRKPGQPESDAWRKTLAGLPQIF
jgi:putative hemin transport protein